MKLLNFPANNNSIAGICAIFQFIYHHQYKWDQIEKNNVLENSGLKIKPKTNILLSVKKSHKLKVLALSLLHFLTVRSVFAESTFDKDTSSCKIIATMSNGTIKTLCDTKENNTTCESLNEMMNKKLESLNGSPSIQNSPNLRLGLKYFQESHSTIQQTPMLLRDCDCAYLMYQNSQVKNKKSSKGYMAL